MNTEPVNQKGYNKSPSKLAHDAYSNIKSAIAQNQVSFMKRSLLKEGNRGKVAAMRLSGNSISKFSQANSEQMTLANDFIDSSDINDGIVYV